MAVNIDADLNNADWIKQSWDLFEPDPSGGLRPLTSLDGFLIFLRVPGAPRDAQRAAVDRFMALPVSKHMPAELRHALEHEGLL